MQQAGEPSVEEILASIKKVIAREQGLAAPEASADRDDPIEPAGPEEAEEILELDEDAVVALSASGEDAPPESEADTPLTGPASAAAMRENFAALAMLAQPGRAPQIVRSGETSLEGLARDLLRPMLAQWLDANLPAIVEAEVKAEIARIAGKKR